MWNRENRGRCDRAHPRYESDLTDAEWAEIRPLIPPAKRAGDKRTVDVGEVVKGAMLPATLFGRFPFLLKLYVDGGYQRPLCPDALKRVLSRARWRPSNDPTKPGDLLFYQYDWSSHTRCLG